MAAKQDKLFTPGNIILGIIIIVLVFSLFFDFLGGSQKEEEYCPYSNPKILFSNVVYSEDGEPYIDTREIKPEYKEGVVYKIEALIRNTDDKPITFTSIALTEENLGPLELTQLEEEITVEAQSMKTIEIIVPQGGYHKIDLYTNGPCEGYTIWHEPGEGSKYTWELEAENATMT